MKANPHFQNNLIVSIVVGVLALIAAGVVYANKPEPVPPADPEVVPVVNVTLPSGTVARSKGLPKAENTNQGGPGPAGMAGGSSGPVAASMAGGSAPGGDGGAPSGPVVAGMRGN